MAKYVYKRYRVNDTGAIDIKPSGTETRVEPSLVEGEIEYSQLLLSGDADAIKRDYYDLFNYVKFRDGANGYAYGKITATISGPERDPSGTIHLKPVN